MKVFTNGTDTFVANDLADVANVYFEHTGVTLEQEMLTLDDFRELPGDEMKTICNLNDGGVDDKATKTCAEWAAENGRGLLCSTEW